MVDLTRVGGAWSNRVYRLVTDRGAYAVKEFRNPWGDPGWLTWLAAAWAFELAAWRAGVDMPEPIPNRADGGCVAWVGSAHGRVPAAGEAVPVRVHRWVDGSPLGEGPVGDRVARWAGRTLARLHSLDARPADRAVFPTAETSTADAWPRLVAQARDRSAPWAELLAAASPSVRAAVDLFAVADRGPEVMSHGDVDQKNILVTASSPVLCDWDVAAPVVARQELADVALSLAGWERFDVAREVVGAYRARGGDGAPIGAADLGPALMVSLDWIALNVERALGVRPAAQDEVALSARLVPRLLADFPQRVAIAGRAGELS